MCTVTVTVGEDGRGAIGLDVMAEDVTGEGVGESGRPQPAEGAVFYISFTNSYKACKTEHVISGKKDLVSNGTALRPVEDGDYRYQGSEGAGRLAL